MPGKLSTISPKWDKALTILKTKGKAKYSKFLDDNNLNMSAFDKCVVGEAWKGKAYYATWDMNKGWKDGLCLYCEGVAVDFSEAVLTNNTKMLGDVHRRFVKHWMDKHV